MTYKDLGTALRKLGQNPTESELEEMIRTCEGMNEGICSSFLFVQLFRQLCLEQHSARFHYLKKKLAFCYVYKFLTRQIILHSKLIIKVSRDDCSSIIFFSGKGSVDFPVFLMLVAKNVNRTDTHDDIIGCFRSFDKEGNGFISAAELRHIMTNIGDKMTDEEVRMFICLLNNLHILRKAFFLTCRNCHGQYYALL